MSGEEVLGWRRAAVRLGWPDSRASGRRLRAMVLLEERKRGVQIATRRGPEGGWTGVTIGALRQHLPWLFRAGARERDELAARLREYLAGVDDRIDQKATDAVTRIVQPQIDELHGRDAKLERRIDAVEQRQAKLERSAANGPKRPETAAP